MRKWILPFSLAIYLGVEFLAHVVTVFRFFKIFEELFFKTSPPAMSNHLRLSTSLLFFFLNQGHPRGGNCGCVIVGLSHIPLMTRGVKILMYSQVFIHYLWKCVCSWFLQFLLSVCLSLSSVKEKMCRFCWFFQRTDVSPHWLHSAFSSTLFYWFPV